MAPAGAEAAACAAAAEVEKAPQLNDSPAKGDVTAPAPGESAAPEQQVGAAAPAEPAVEANPEPAEAAAPAHGTASPARGGGASKRKKGGEKKEPAPKKQKAEGSRSKSANHNYGPQFAEAFEIFMRDKSQRKLVRRCDKVLFPDLALSIDILEDSHSPLSAASCSCAPPQVGPGGRRPRLAHRAVRARLLARPPLPAHPPRSAARAPARPAPPGGGPSRPASCRLPASAAASLRRARTLTSLLLPPGPTTASSTAAPSRATGRRTAATACSTSTAKRSGSRRVSFIAVVHFMYICGSSSALAPAPPLAPGLSGP